MCAVAEPTLRTVVEIMKSERIRIIAATGGAGVQAREHIAAIHCVRDISQTFVAARERGRCERLVSDMGAAQPAIADISPALDRNLLEIPLTMEDPLGALSFIPF